MKQASGKLLALLLSVTMLCGLCVPTAFATESEFSDTNGHWAQAAIDRWCEYGVVQGKNGSFDPDGSLTRAQMAIILTRLLVLPEAESSAFDDVNEGDWFAKAVNCCYAAGIMQGSSGKAMPDSPITREQTVTMLCRALGVAPRENPDLTAYTDAAEVSSYAKGSIAAMLEAGIVKGTAADALSPKANITRAAFVTILDRAIGTYAAKAGVTVDAADNSGLILIVAKNVTVKNAPKGVSVIIAHSATGATVNGKPVTAGSSYTVAAEQSKPTTSGNSSGGGSGSGGGNGGSSISNLTVSTAKVVTGGTYQNVTITAAVGDGTVTLDGVTINGALTVSGGGSSTVNLKDCTMRGEVVLDKAGGEAPRLNLTNTPISAIRAVKPAILEADATSAIAAVTAGADVEIRGRNTAVAAITVPAGITMPIALTVSAGSVERVTAKGETTVTGAANAIESVVVEAHVSVASETVVKAEIPSTAPANIAVAVTGTAPMELEINSTKGVAITTSGTATVEVSTALEAPPANVILGGAPITHIHRWNEGTITQEPTCNVAGEKTYTCTATGCTNPAATKTAKIPTLPHTIVADPTVAATCTTAGKTAGKRCSVCGAVIVAQTEIAPLGHNWGEWKKADDTNHKRICGNDASHIETAAHTWNAGVITTPPTESTDGVKTYTCTVCEATKAETISAGDSLVGKNGFDIAWTVSGHLEPLITAPTEANSDTYYTIYLYNSATSEYSYFGNCKAKLHGLKMAISAGEYDRVRLYTTIDGSDYSGETVLAEWVLDKKIISRKDADEFPHASVTVTASTERKGEYQFSNLDYGTYGYVLMNPSTKASLMFNSNPVILDNKWIGDGMQLTATRTVETETAYTQSESKPYSINIPVSA